MAYSSYSFIKFSNICFSFFFLSIPNLPMFTSSGSYHNIKQQRIYTSALALVSDKKLRDKCVSLWIHFSVSALVDVFSGFLVAILYMPLSAPLCMTKIVKAFRSILLLAFVSVRACTSEHNNQIKYYTSSKEHTVLCHENIPFRICHIKLSRSISNRIFRGKRKKNIALFAFPGNPLQKVVDIFLLIKIFCGISEIISEYIRIEMGYAVKVFLFC